MLRPSQAISVRIHELVDLRQSLDEYISDSSDRKTLIRVRDFLIREAQRLTDRVQAISQTVSLVDRDLRITTRTDAVWIVYDPDADDEDRIVSVHLYEDAARRAASPYARRVALHMAVEG